MSEAGLDSGRASSGFGPMNLTKSAILTSLCLSSVRAAQSMPMLSSEITSWGIFKTRRNAAMASASFKVPDRSMSTRKKMHSKRRPGCPLYAASCKIALVSFKNCAEMCLPCPSLALATRGLRTLRQRATSSQGSPALRGEGAPPQTPSLALWWLNLRLAVNSVT
eukprot:CAMPEP_0206532908 /NCGR_PEP_ID=MMETSP0325_2-20121206/4658_1 /ASSEMBLY_ACC=CAM_ASM_000347 /TAXON_ID=2866 /ORGANISM="Crypthecodinium cohnii, Strain Seligo" /LENGTH=164 /DNA_ID=CAMNT_0054029467 /DNA_START=156 /DNA_END=650 /DNA_ORIENTATION=+